MPPIMNKTEGIQSEITSKGMKLGIISRIQKKRQNFWEERDLPLFKDLEDILG